ncbi:MAG: glycosyl transferase family 4, partial [Gammaproteobacteria bacterium]
LGIVWMTNLYNFMDGTDGLAAAQAVTAAGTGGLLLMQHGALPAGLYSLAIAAAAAGFLVFNRPPARIFMGDVGSYFLGFTLAVLAVAGERTGQLSLWCSLTLLAWFLTDATLTLLMRIARGDPWHQAHREHAYQRLVQMGWSHGRLLAAFLALQLFILIPLALLGSFDPGIALGGFLCATALCAILWVTIQNRYQRSIQGSPQV